LSAIGDRHAAGAVGFDEAGHPDQGILAPEDRVEPVVVDPPVDDVDPAETAGRAHEDQVLVDHQVGSLHQLDAHLLGEVEVLVVGGVVDPGCQQHHRRLGDPFGREPAEVAEQVVAVALHGPDGVALEEIRENPLHDRPVGEDVGDARWRAQVVLEDQELAPVVADQVHAGDVAADAARSRHPIDLAQVEGARQHRLGRHHALPEDQLAAVDVLEEMVQGPHPLLEPGLQPGPGAGRDDAGDHVERKDLLDALLVGIDREGDAVVAEGAQRSLVAFPELDQAEVLEVIEEPPVGAPRLGRRRQHLVVKGFRLVAGADRPPRSHGYSVCRHRERGSISEASRRLRVRL
jgi:hypothetical protein